jgi:2-polyprenyl-3-methyl-5-hydroxy-6-metoxy-1,4-benzoquinol methylase
VDVAEALDFEDLEAVAGLCRAHGPFDTILALDLLEHLRDPWATLAVLGSALLPGGRVLVSVPNVLSSDVLLPLLFADRFDYADGGVLDRTHLRWFTRKTAIELALSPGFVLEEVRTNPLPLRFRLAKLLSLGLLTRFVAWQWLVMVRKPD